MPTKYLQIPFKGMTAEVVNIPLGDFELIRKPRKVKVSIFMKKKFPWNKFFKGLVQGWGIILLMWLILLIYRSFK